MAKLALLYGCYDLNGILYLELKIHISPQTKEVLDKFGCFDIKRRRQSVTLKVIYSEPYVCI